MGMGRAMSDWLDTARPVSTAGEGARVESAWRGLDRVRDTLVEAAGRDVDGIVKEWGWHEGLEAPRSRSTTPAPDTEDGDSVPLTTQSPQIPAASRVPVGQTRGNESSIASMSVSEKTPTAPNVAILPPTPNLPAFPRPTPAVIAHRPTPAILLSSRDDKPATGLTRVPVSAPPKIPNGWGGAGTNLMVRPAADRFQEGGDPLAGLGTSSKRLQDRVGRIGGGGGLGGDPLGAG